MRDTAPIRTKLIEHLEQALLLSEELGESPAGFCIERALDMIRAADVRNLGKPK